MNASFLTPYISIKPTADFNPAQIPQEVKQDVGFIKTAFKTEKERPNKLDNYGNYQDRLSNDLLATYYDPQKDVFNIGLRGTDLSSFDRAVKDLKSDAGLITNNIQGDKQYRDAYNIVRKIKNQNRKSKIDLYGFSLGGGIANQLSNDVSRVKSKAYNPAIFNWSDSRDNPNNFTYRFKNDIVSMGSDPQRLKNFETPKFYSHGINRFLE